MQRIKALRTEYRGISFRSKLEAQWAKFHDSVAVRWDYEPETFEFSDGTLYMPDFFLPDSKQWFEVKGVMTEKDKHKIEMLCKESGYDVIVGYSNGEFEMCDTRLLYGEEGKRLTWYSKDETYLNRCPNCGKLSYMNEIGSYECQCCGFYAGDEGICWIMSGDSSENKYSKITTDDWLKRATIDVRR
jgi:ribosomal protein L32